MRKIEKSIVFQFFFSDNRVTFIRKYSKQYFKRFLSVFCLSNIFYLVTNAWDVAVCFGFYIEFMIIDMYTSRLMPPAFMMMSEEMYKDEESVSARILFLVTNSIVLFFILYVVFFLKKN